MVCSEKFTNKFSHQFQGDFHTCARAHTSRQNRNFRSNSPTCDKNSNFPTIPLSENARKVEVFAELDVRIDSATISTAILHLYTHANAGNFYWVKNGAPRPIFEKSSKNLAPSYKNRK
jgi:hypothetical protein